MYSLDCSYYTKEFKSLDDLVQDVISCGMDPNYEITFEGNKTGELLIDHIQI